MSETGGDLSPASRALLELAAERPWTEVSLRGVAQRAGLDFSELFRTARSREGLLFGLAAELDRAALATADAGGEDVHDRLFDAAMARLEAMEPHRAALVAIARQAPRLLLAAHFPATARAILEAAGVPATPPRIAGMTLAWARIAQVWRDDEGALNRTMAELDKRLRQLRARLNRIHAGF